ncbi:MAG: peptidylprolyl isomerase [bacterium]
MDPKPIVTIEMADGNKMQIELEATAAPNTVSNFLSLVRQGFYDGLTFHRVIPGFMIQGGDPAGNGSGGPDYRIKGEFPDNGFPNPLKHERGVISMARTPAPDSAGSQFFIMVDRAPHLDGSYAAFGRVTEGMEEADRIAALPRDRQNKPNSAAVIKKMTAETFGVAYPEPEKIT